MQAAEPFTTQATIVVPMPFRRLSTELRSKTVTFAVVIADRSIFSTETPVIDLL